MIYQLSHPCQFQFTHRRALWRRAVIFLTCGGQDNAAMHIPSIKRIKKRLHNQSLGGFGVRILSAAVSRAISMIHLRRFAFTIFPTRVTLIPHPPYMHVHLSVCLPLPSPVCIMRAQFPPHSRPVIRIGVKRINFAAG